MDSIRIIDTHQHFWKYEPKEYGWIGDNMKSLRRDFLPPDLKKVMDEAGVSGSVSVQARQTVEETEWLLSLAEKHEYLLGVVGWAPLAEKGVEKYLEKFATHKKMKGVRHVVQDEPDQNFILRPEFNAGVSLLRKYNLRYDILIFERHLRASIAFVDRHPNQIFVLDHIAKPRIKERMLSPWRENMVELAKRSNVYCKLSGMVTEADWKTWTGNDLAPYIDGALHAFGPKRLMFGSDWPVLLAAGQYKPWVDLVKKSISKLTHAEQEQILSKNAVAAYGL